MGFKRGSNGVQNVVKNGVKTGLLEFNVVIQLLHRL